MKFQLVELENLKLEESQNMHKAVIYIHGKGGTSSESEHYKALFKDADVIGFDYQ